MVEIVGAGTALHFNPKYLGLNAGFLGLFFNSLKLNFRDSFRTVQIEFKDCFRAVQS